MPSQPSSAFPYPSQRVIVFRHGERRDNHPDAPAESNPPLTAEGVLAVKGSAARLRHYLGEAAARAAVLIVSPFLRTVQTAEALQHNGIGTDHAMIIDNTLCEVFGPSRIKTGRAPQLQAPPTAYAVGGLPMWGESLETATQRYVTNFLRNGDAYGGLDPRAGLSDPSMTLREESQSSSSLLCPAAVTKRTNGVAAPTAAAAAPAITAAASSASQDSALMSTARSGQPRDVILVTHGDAISAVLSHFYPARVVYEADFLSFIIMRRYGVGNRVYHLDESAGVNWFVEGIDREPQDPILRALEMEREAALAAADAAAKNNGSGNGTAIGKDNDSAGDDDPDEDEDDDEGEALDDDVAEDAHPASFAGSRMKSRTSRLPPRRAQPRATPFSADVEASASHNALPPTQMHPPLQPNPHSPAARTRRGTSASSGSNGGGSGGGGGGGSVSGGGTSQARTAHSGGQHVSRNHPKAGEDCERIRLPDGTPAQSSSASVTSTMEDCTNHRRGHSSSTSSGGEAANNVDDVDTRQRGEGGEEKEDTEGRAGLGGDGGPPATQRTTASPEGDRGSAALVQWADVKALELSARGQSSYGGLTADTSTASWVKTQANSSIYFSAVAARERAMGTASVIAVPASAAAAAISVATPTLTAQTMSRQSSTVLSPAAPLSTTKSSPRHNLYGAAPLPHFASPSFDDSTTSAPTYNAAVHTAPLDGGDDGERGAATHLARRIDRHKALGKATLVSYAARFVCLLLAVASAVTAHMRAALAWYAVVAVVWEVVSALVLSLSCRTASRRVLCVRRAVEQLRWGLVAAQFATRSRDAHGPAGSTTTPVAAAHEDGASETPFYQFQSSATSNRHYESSMVWQAGSHALGDDEETHFAAEQRPTPMQLGLLCGRHVAATSVKLAALYFLSFLCALLTGVGVGRGWGSLAHLYTNPASLVITLLFACVNVTRGVWDETRIDTVIDRN